MARRRLLQRVDEIANGDAVDVGLGFGLEGAGEVGDFAFGEVAVEEGSREVAAVLVEFVD